VSESSPLPTEVLPAGIRARFVSGINGLRMHILEAGSPGRPAILLLHGYLQDKRSVTSWAVRFAQAGYRCALVDLRGHGASTGIHISFGAFESRDLQTVLDDLERFFAGATTILLPVRRHT